MKAVPVHVLVRLRRMTISVSAAAIGIVNVAMQRRESIVEREAWGPPGARFLIAWILLPFLPSKGSDAAARCDRGVSDNLDIDKKVSAASHGGDASPS